MSRYRYLITIGDRQDPPAFAAGLHDHGLRARVVVGGAAVFTSEETPCVALSGDALALGRIFRADGRRLVGDESELDGLSPAALRDFFVTHCWGEYLLLQADDADPGGLVVTRDPAPSGTFPCLYSVAADGAFIASDVATAIDCGLYRRRIDWEVIAHCLAFPQAKIARAALAGMQELLPGMTLHLGRRKQVLSSAWSPWNFVGADQRQDDRASAAVDVRDAVSVAVRSLVGERSSVLLELSGGLDSSIVGMALCDTSADITCCTLHTPLPGADERVYAAQIAQAIGVPLDVAHISVEDAAFDFALPADTAAPRVGALQQVIDRAMQAARPSSDAGTAHITGGGGDAVFAYLKTSAPAVDALRERGLSHGATAIRELATLHDCTLWRTTRLTAAKLLRGRRDFLEPDASHLSAGALAPPLDSHPWNDAPPQALPGDVERIFALSVSQMFRDSAPRAALHGMHMPLLSQPVVEACLRAPSWMWIAGGRNRAVARDAFAGLLPRDILTRRSKGSFMNYIGAVYARNRAAMLAYLMEGELQAHDLLDADSLGTLARNPSPNRDRAFVRIFDLCTIENWVRRQS